MKLSVVIPTYNRLSKLQECLKHLEQQTLDRAKFEVLVVDDGSTDKTHAFLTHYKENSPLSFNFFVQENSGQGAARNRGISHAKGEVILFLGDDIYAEETLLAAHHNFHTKKTSKTAACLGFITWDPRHSITPLMKFLERGGALFGRWGGGQFAYDLLEGKTTADWHFFYTSNISLKKELLEKENFDESFKGYGWEDIDLGLRLFEKENLELFYNPHARAVHDHPQTMASFTKREYTVGRALPFFQAKHPQHKMLPSPEKKAILWLISRAPLLALWKIIWRDLYFYALSKRHFLMGLHDGILSQK